ncbi:hypothetical protein OG462_40540 [Streptomyces sp. NBC_01077]|uniref:hypothetical protein n=1 Tax=Streptomyces sp. NBC_01077 TaxID=2903746 RepID=UPI003870D7A8|nr:hypothetical protein OG462_40540 [Streptomyces sp. NBC_01077]
MSTILCDVGGRQFEVLLTAGEEQLLQAVAARLSDGGKEHGATRNGIQRNTSGA